MMSSFRRPIANCHSQLRTQTATAVFGMNVDLLLKVSGVWFEQSYVREPDRTIPAERYP
jgi:hypothetical protein